MSQASHYQQHANRRLGLVITGGTIGAELSDTDAVVRIRDGGFERTPAEISLLRDAWRGGGPLDVSVREPLRCLSENMVPTDWTVISESVRELVATSAVEGVLVLHGTDTAAYTSAALAFCLADLQIPLVVTGSNWPPNQPGSDAQKNIRDALVALGQLSPGVYLSFAGSPQRPSYVHVGTRVRKVRASGQAFYSINRRPVAKVEGDEYLPIQLYEHIAQPFRSTQQFDERVMSVRLYPGLDLDGLAEFAIATDIGGIVVELYASATGPDLSNGISLPRFVARCSERGIVVTTTLAEAPRGHTNVYESTVAIRDAGAVFLEDLLPETATVKLMWALAQVREPRAIEKLMRQPIAGEVDATA